MLDKQYKKEMKQITPSQDLINRTKMAMREEMQSKPKRPLFRKAVALATVAAIVAFVIFSTNLLNQTNDIFFPDNLFTIRAYAMEIQPDGTIKLREVDISQLEGWTGHDDGEALFISIGLWFDFEGYNIKTVEFSLAEGFFATQYIGNFVDASELQQAYVGIDGRLAMYGTEFDKVGNVIKFGDVMDSDILLFWGSYGVRIDEWYLNPIEISVIVTFDDGEIYEQPLRIEFNVPGITTIEEWPQNHSEFIRLERPTMEQYEHFATAPLEDFTLIPESIKVITPTTHFEFYVGGHTPVTISIPTFPEYWDASRIINDPYNQFDENGISRVPMGIRDDEGFIVVIKLDADGVFTAMTYVVPLQK
ncbi:MAG: hypothetical protein FWC89_00430 [Defluviitaleaceae bacterium]|nr:hypothetical protein [Defluviitaleaceae bacterium]